jgi:hypothetical protein
MLSFPLGFPTKTMHLLSPVPNKCSALWPTEWHSLRRLLNSPLGKPSKQTNFTRQ